MASLLLDKRGVMPLLAISENTQIPHSSAIYCLKLNSRVVPIWKCVQNLKAGIVGLYYLSIYLIYKAMYA